MTDNEIDMFVNGKAALVPGVGGFHIEKLEPRTKDIPLPKKYKIGQEVVYDHINGTAGRCVGEGIIEEINNKQTYGDYFVSINKERDTFMWFRECELTEKVDF